MSKNTFPNTRLATILFALPFAGAGALIMLVAADVIHADPASIHAPRWVLGATGFVFFIAGIWILFQGFAGGTAEDITFGKWVNYAFGLVFMVAFSAIFIWVGLGPGERQFTSSGSVGPVGVSSSGNELIGRCMFGGMGVLMGVGTLWFAVKRPMQILGYHSNPSQKEDEH